MMESMSISLSSAIVEYCRGERRRKGKEKRKEGEREREGDGERERVKVREREGWDGWANKRKRGRKKKRKKKIQKQQQATDIHTQLQCGPKGGGRGSERVARRERGGKKIGDSNKATRHEILADAVVSRRLLCAKH